VKTLLLVTVLISCAACADLPRKSPPLEGMQEPLELMQEPQDEAQRAQLPAGGFTGVVVGDARASLDALLGQPEGVLVTSVVENSPGAVAGITEGDLLLEVRGRETTPLHWPSEWRRVELEAEPDSVLHVVLDRAGAEFEADITVVRRVQPAAREASDRFRDEARVGVVLRRATEVEARAAALGPGGGAVVVGLSVESPWRKIVVYGDLIRAVDGVEVGHPHVVLDAIRAAKRDSKLELEVVRGGAITTLEVPVSRREQQLSSVSIPLIYSYERERDRTNVSVLLGIFRWRSTPAAWDVRLLWLISFGGGDSNRLEAVER
jgi:C-terminal processing protease CtpA/Prc